MTVSESIAYVEKLRAEYPRDARRDFPLVRNFPAITENLFILPIAAKDALNWIAGKIDDEQLIFCAPIVPEAVFAVTLPENTLPEAIKSVAALYERGAVCMIGRARETRWLAMLKKRGVVETAIETDEFKSRRYILPPEKFRSWFGRYARHSCLCKSKNKDDGTMSASRQ